MHVPLLIYYKDTICVVTALNYCTSDSGHNKMGYNFHDETFHICLHET